MMAQFERCRTPPTTRQARTVAVIGRSPLEAALQAVTGAMDHDIVFLESLAHGYSHIKRVRPHLIVLCLSDHDIDGCQVLSMLMLDGETCRIPMVMCMTPAGSDLNRGGADMDADVFGHLDPISLN